jgi:hypothetical protein
MFDGSGIQDLNEISDLGDDGQKTDGDLGAGVLESRGAHCGRSPEKTQRGLIRRPRPPGLSQPDAPRGVL